MPGRRNRPDRVGSKDSFHKIRASFANGTSNLIHALDSIAKVGKDTVCPTRNDREKAESQDLTMLQILKLTVSGLPQEWLSLEEAVLYYATGQVLWEAGSEIATLHGGHNARSGQRSEVTVNSIIGVNGMGRVN